ncbi:hypothetical protein LX36DRAFT_655754 [Colletotrichum falcatum]|nr:hypothetical protein LX36DRAFT_655754 [Colletotrichum falcatum]
MDRATHGMPRLISLPSKLPLIAWTLVTGAGIGADKSKVPQKCMSSKRRMLRKKKSGILKSAVLYVPCRDS